MIKNDPNHKKAFVKTAKNISKAGIAISLAGIAGISSVLIYSGFKKEDIHINNDVVVYNTAIHNGWDIVSGEAEKIIYDDLYESYKDYLERKQGKEDNSADKMDVNKNLVYDETLSDSDIVEVDDSAKREILRKLKRYNEIDDENVKITVGDLKQIEDLYFGSGIEVDSDTDLSWLNYCKNLRFLDLEINDEKGFECLNQIKGLDKLYKIFISKGHFYKGNAKSINDEYFSFLKNCPELRNLQVDSLICALDDDFLKDIGNKEYGYHIDIDNFFAFSQKIDPTKLEKCSSLTIYAGFGTGIYDIATVFSREQFNKLVEAEIEVEVITDDGRINQDEMINKVNKIYEQIDNIVDQLDINENMSQSEKLNKVLEFVLNDLTYSKAIREKIEEDKAESKDKIKISGFGEENEIVEMSKELSYKDGYLYGALDSDGEPICGTYAAFMKVLLDKVGVEAYLTTSDEHAYNLVNIDDEYYYVDATFLDEEVIDMDKITNNNQHLINTSFAGMHKTNFMPPNIDLDSNPNIEEEVNRVVENELGEYKVKFNNQIFTLSLAGLISLLSITGLAISKRQIEAILEKEKYRHDDEEIDDEESLVLLDSVVDISKKEVNSNDMMRMTSHLLNKQNSKAIDQDTQEPVQGGKDD